MCAPQPQIRQAARCGVYQLASAQMFYPLMMTLEKGVGVFALIFSRCVVSGLLAIRKLRDANPADIF